MNLLSRITISVFIISIITTGCVSVTDTLYLQDAQVFGPIIQPPVTFMNTDSDKKFSFSPKLYFNGTKRITGQVTGHSKVNSKGIFQVDSSFDESGLIRYSESRTANRYEYNSSNLTWKTPGYIIGLDADFFVSSKLTITSGFSISEVDQKNLLGWKIGLGFGGFSGDFGLRFDAGLVWQEYAYDASSVIVREISPPFERSTSEVFFFSDKGTTTNFNHYLSINLHYANSDALFNPFISIAYSRQSILDFEPNNRSSEFVSLIKYDNNDQRGGAHVSYLVITPGSSFYVNDWIKLVASAKFFTGSDIRNVSQESFIVPAIQLEFLF